MEATLSVKEASEKLAEIVDRASDHGESTILLKDGLPAARVVPIIEVGVSCAEFAEFLQGPRPRLGVEEAEAFEKDLLEARELLPMRELKWD